MYEIYLPYTIALRYGKPDLIDLLALSRVQQVFMAFGKEHRIIYEEMIGLDQREKEYDSDRISGFS